MKKNVLQNINQIYVRKFLNHLEILCKFFYSCSSSGNQMVPKSMVNIEVPVSSQTQTWKWTSPGHVVDLGRLGPTAR